MQVRDYVGSITLKDEEGILVGAAEIRKNKNVHNGGVEKNLVANLEMELGEYVGVEDDSEISEDNLGAKAEDDGLADMWQEFDLALQSAKVFPI